MFAHFQHDVDLTSDNPWNLPDWRDPSAYPNDEAVNPYARVIEHTEEWVWYWEFLRRRPSYQDLWLEYQNNRREWQQIDDHATSREISAAQRLGMNTLISPAVKAHDASDGYTEPEKDAAIPVIWRKNDLKWAGVFRKTDLYEVSPAFEDMSDFCLRAHRRGQYIAAITPTERLEEQLAGIRKEFESWNQEFGSKHKNLRLQTRKYPLYLRLLDARYGDTPTSWEKIADRLALEPDYKDRSSRSFQKSYDAAKDLVENARHFSLNPEV